MQQIYIITNINNINLYMNRLTLINLISLMLTIYYNYCNYKLKQYIIVVFYIIFIFKIGYLNHIKRHLNNFADNLLNKKYSLSNI
jgi:hypothetical protein